MVINDKKSNLWKKTIVSILLIAVLIVCVVSLSYALFSYSKTGEKINNLVTGILDMTYTENSNAIAITDAIPLSDSNGKILTGSGYVFDFTVNAMINGSATISYVITASKSSTSTLDDSAIKVYLTSGTTETEVLPPTKMSDLAKTVSGNSAGAPVGEFILLSSSTDVSTSNTYHLRMWLADDYEGVDIADPTYKITVNVYGKAAAQ